MREILFRGKRKGIGEWVYGYYAYCTDGCEFSHRIHTTFAETYGGENLSPVWFEVIPETVGQYTGLTDKNGKKVFTGDIVKAFGKNYQCVFDEYNFEYEFGNPKESFGLACVYNKDVEMIGNIHDNPELLKGSVEDA